MAHKTRKKTRVRSKQWFYINFLLAGLLIVGAGLGFIWANKPVTSAATVASLAADTPVRAAPNFTLKTLSGETVSLTDYRGQVVLVNFWASWCPPCVAELPTLHQFYLSHKSDGFVVLAVNAEENEPTIRQFVEQNGYTFPVLVDSAATAANAYDVRAIPASFIVDQNGNIQYIHRGEIDTQTLKTVVEPLLTF